MKVAMIGLRAVREGLGGIETALYHLAPRLAKLGFDITTYGRQRYAAGSPPEGIREIMLPSLAGKHTETISYAALAALMADKYDLLHFHAQGPAMLSWLPRLRRQRSIVTLHGLDWARPKWNPMASMALKLGEYCALRYGHQVTVVSEHLYNHYRGRAHGCLQHIPNGVQWTQAPSSTKALEQFNVQGGQYLLFLGRLVADKDCETLLKAYKQVPGDWPLLFAGPEGDSAPYQQRLKKLAAADHRVQIIGSVQGQVKQELIHNAGLFVLPSKVEGLSLALLEAMQASLPIVASDIQPNQEAAGDSACYFPVGQEVELSKTIRQLLESPSRRQEMGALACKRAKERFNWDHIAQQYARIYHESLGAW